MLGSEIGAAIAWRRVGGRRRGGPPSCCVDAQAKAEHQAAGTAKRTSIRGRLVLARRCEGEGDERARRNVGDRVDGARGAHEWVDR